MATPVIDTNDGTNCGQGQSVIITSAMLDSHEPTAQAFDYVIVTLPLSGTLYLKSVPLTTVGAKFTQEDIDNEDLIFENEGLLTDADLFSFTLRDREALPNESVSAEFDLTIDDLNNGFLVTLTSVGTATIVLRFSEESQANAYKSAWDLSHLGTSTVQKLATDNTNFAFAPLNEADAEHHLEDPDHYLDTQAVKRATKTMMDMLPYKSPELIHLVRMYGPLLETTALGYVEDSADWSIIVTTTKQQAPKYHDYVATLTMVQAKLQ